MNIKILKENMRRFGTKNLTEQGQVDIEDIESIANEPPPAIPVEKDLKISDTFVAGQPFYIKSFTQVGTEGELGTVTYKIFGPGDKLLYAVGQDGKPDGELWKKDKNRGSGGTYAFMLGNSWGFKNPAFTAFIRDAFGVTTTTSRQYTKMSSQSGFVSSKYMTDEEYNDLKSSNPAEARKWKVKKGSADVRANIDENQAKTLLAYWNSAIGALKQMQDGGNLKLTADRLSYKMNNAKKSHAKFWPAPFGTAS